MKKVFNEKQFKKICEDQGITFDKFVWNAYMDRAWAQIEKELESGELFKK